MTEDFGTDELLSKIDELDLETETTTMSANEKSRVQKPPFPELRYLNLANNKVRENIENHCRVGNPKCFRGGDSCSKDFSIGYVKF